MLQGNYNNVPNDVRMMSQICPHTPTELALLVLIILITLFTVITAIAAIVIIIVIVVVVIVVIVLIDRAYDFIQIVLKIASEQRLKGVPLHLFCIVNGHLLL